MENSIRYTLHLVCLLAAIALCNGSKDFDVKTFESKVDGFVKAALACHDNPGLSLSVVKDNKVVLSKGYGHKKTDKREPVTDTTLFGIGALSKAFAATLLLQQLTNYPKLLLSSPVKKVVEGKIFSGDLRQTYTTLEDLLAHRTGIPGNNAIRMNNKLNRRNIANRFQYLKPVAGFRTSFFYNHLMYGLVTRISEILGKTSWEQLVQRKIFDALGMPNSTFLTTADTGSLDIASGYVMDGGKLFSVPFEFLKQWNELCGAGCILSNGQDMAKWMMFNLNGGKNQKNKVVLDSVMLEQAHAPKNGASVSHGYHQRPVTPVSFSTFGYGLGWRIGMYRGFQILTHTGSADGYQAMITLTPSLKAGVFTAMSGTDKGHRLLRNIQLYVGDLLAGDTPWLNTSTVCSFPQPWRNQTTMKALPKRPDVKPNRKLSFYAGTFRNPAYGLLNVYVNASTDKLMAKYGFGEMVLHPKTKPDEFYGEGVGILEHIRDYATFRFRSPSGSGKVMSVVVPSFEPNSPPVFMRYVAKPKPSQSKSKNGASVNRSLDIICLTVLAVVPTLALL